MPKTITALLDMPIPRAGYQPVGYAAKVQADIAAGRPIPHEEVVKQLGW